MSPGGKFNVKLPATPSPHFKYPKNPNVVNRTVTKIIPILRTPHGCPNVSGFFIEFFSGRTCEKNVLKIRRK